MWAVSRYDYGLTDEEFGCLQLPQFWMLWDRHLESFKRLCYGAGLVAAAIYNCNRTESTQRLFSPIDFIPQTLAETEKEELIEMLRKWASQIPSKSRSKARSEWKTRLVNMGRQDADEILEKALGKQ